MFDRARCPVCDRYVRPFETVESIPTAVGMVVDKGVKVRRRYRHCGQEWERTYHRPPRWRSRQGPGT
jgi:hypothetical protein